MTKTLLLLEMPELAREKEIRFAMYFDDHARPHVHAIHGSQKASIEIDTLKVTGQLPRRRMSFAKAWVKLNQAVLNEFWGALEGETKKPSDADANQRRVLKGRLKSPVMKKRATKKKTPPKKATASSRRVS